MEAIRIPLGNTVVRVDTADFELMELVSLIFTILMCSTLIFDGSTDFEGGDEGIVVALYIRGLKMNVFRKNKRANRFPFVLLF